MPRPNRDANYVFKLIQGIQLSPGALPVDIQPVPVWSQACGRLALEQLDSKLALIKAKAGVLKFLDCLGGDASDCSLLCSVLDRPSDKPRQFRRV